MPIYEYTCQSCNRKFDHLARTMSSADAKVKCPECGSPKTARALSVFAAHSNSAPSASPRPTGGCGRCGDPNGSCSF